MAIFCCFKTCFKSLILISPKWKILAAKAPVASFIKKLCKIFNLSCTSRSNYRNVNNTRNFIKQSHIKTLFWFHQNPWKSTEFRQLLILLTFLPNRGFYSWFYSSSVHKNVIFISKLFRIYCHNYTLTPEFICKSFD